jgi:titin
MFSNSSVHNPGERPRHRQRPARRRAERRFVRPQVVPLEDRLLPSVYLVTNTNNDGAGSLRQAILDANVNPGYDTIEFDLEPDIYIVLTSPLPTIADPVFIDGTSQPGWVRDPVVGVIPATDDNGRPVFDSNGLSLTADGCKVKGVLLAGFGEAGIGVYSNNNLIAGNWLANNGRDDSVVAAGIDIANAVSGNVIGGTTVRARNVIWGNYAAGVFIHERSTGNLVEGNYIGTDPTGTAASGRQFEGLVILDGADNNTVGGTAAGAGNVISGNAVDGLEITGATGCLVQGNKVGTDFSGTTAVPNGTGGDGAGVFVQASSNTIGGTAAGAGNLISGNSGAGIFLNLATTTLVQGNRIGTNAAGTAALANSADGVFLLGSSSNTVGGTAAGAGNLISGNVGLGIRFQDDTLDGVAATANLVQGNFIGTNAAGTAAVGNGQSGVGIFGSQNTVGGTAAGAGNLISGNGSYGIDIEAGTTANLVQGNKIGTNAAGATALGNSYAGVSISGSNNTVGGTAAGAGNLISGNGFDGILITGVANLVQGNKIGTNAAGTGAVANGLSGVHIFASNNTVGGTAAGAANTIAFNKAVGVFVDSGTGNAIRQNSIFANAGLGIRLNPGANNNQPAPTLSAARFIPFVNLLTAQGTLTGVAGSQVTLEFFASPAGDPEGKVYLGSLVVTIGANGTASFTFMLKTNKVSAGMVLTATATDPTNGTSEFSTGRTV